MPRTLRHLNDGTGVSVLGDDGDHIKDIRIYPESGSIQVWIELRNGGEFMQYLNSREAMAIALMLEKMAVEALRSESVYF